MKISRLTASTLFTASALTMAFMAQSAQAGFIVSDFNNTRGCLVTEVTLNGTAPPTEGYADACIGYVAAPGNPTEEQDQINLYTLDQVGDPDLAGPGEDPTNTEGLWKFADKSEGTDAALFTGIAFEVTFVNTNPDGTGTWKISWTDTSGDPNLPTTLDLAFGFKAATEIVYFLFDDVAITAVSGCTSPTADGCSSGSFDLQINKDLSHETMFVREGGSGDQTEVPEPGVLFLMGAGLLGLGMARRRKSA